ncbi:MAG TPA: hypothetical protein VHC95_06975 [Opitutales bacterium]|nr:hypothetical protein [Opitutales bacterium]
MKIITAGHKYELANLASDTTQTLQFVEKQPIPGDPSGKLQTVTDGTTNEEVLQVLIDRMKFLQGKVACPENAKAIGALEQALLWLRNRTAHRQARSVEGTSRA